MNAIFKREFRSYFASPVGYVYVSVFFLVASLFFGFYNLLYQSGDISYVFSNMTMVFQFLTPVLTMRLLAEEKNNKTDQLLLTSPVKVHSIVLGKLFAAIAVLAIALSVTLLFPILLVSYTEPSWGKIFGSYLGILLIGSTCISIGLYISSLTENQIIAAVGTFAVLFLVFVFEMVGSSITNPVLSQIIYWLSFTAKFADFGKGIINIPLVFYYVSIIAAFSLLTIGQIEKKRWTK